MSDSNSFQQLQARLQDVHNLRMAEAVLSWDQEVYMPPKGATARGAQLATLSAQTHRLFTDPETGALLESLRDEQESLTEDEQALLREARYDYDRAVRIPEKLVRAFAEVQSQAYHAWLQARADDDFPRFLPHLKELITLSKEQAVCLNPEVSAYDALLENYERGMTSAELEKIFSYLAKEQSALLQEITEKQAAESASVLAENWDKEAQRRFTEKVLTDMGFDFEAGRQDVSAHPFTTNFSRGDVRVTTRYSTKEPFSALFSSIHEGGHALYEQGFLEKDEGTLLASAPSLGIHESQSRLWENMVGRSRAFWRCYGTLFRDVFPEQAGALSDDDLFRAVNRVSPSLIRVDADECSYNLHVILRFEIEKALFNNDILTEEIPTLWRDKMKAYLGVTVPDDRQGCLQDIHWSHGAFGYFPTYALGNLYGAQLFERMEEEMPSLQSNIEAGYFQPMLHWLRTNIHQWGRRELTVPLLERACGASLSADSFIHYLKTKYLGAA
jgi:carboxypeptidase Taq